MRLPRLTSHAGYSLVEMIVVLPIMTITLIAIFSLVHENLRQVTRLNTESRLRINAESALYTIRDDIQNLISFHGMNPPITPDVHIPDTFSGPIYTDRWMGIQHATWISSDSYLTRAIIYTEPAYTAPPQDPSRQLIYRANTPNSCTEIAAGTADGLNEYAINTIIIFPRDNIIWKRTLTEDPSTLCGTNYKKTSCAATDTRGGPGDLCEADDTPLITTGVNTIYLNFPVTITYYTYYGSTTTLKTYQAPIELGTLYDGGNYGPFARVTRINLTIGLTQDHPDGEITATASIDLRRTN